MFCKQQNTPPKLLTSRCGSPTVRNTVTGSLWEEVSYPGFEHLFPGAVVGHIPEHFPLQLCWSHTRASPAAAVWVTYYMGHIPEHLPLPLCGSRTQASPAAAVWVTYPSISRCSCVDHVPKRFPLQLCRSHTCRVLGVRLSLPFDLPSQL